MTDEQITDTIAFLNRKSRHHATLASQATTSDVAFVCEDEAKRYAVAATCLRELAEAFRWLEKNTTLHYSPAFLYVVDGYRVAVERDGNEDAHAQTRDTLLEAIKARTALGEKA